MDAETILKIDELQEHDDYPHRGGYLIETTQQQIKLLMADEQQCCESYGYFMSEDDLQSFVGAELLGVSITDTLLNTKQLDRIQPHNSYDGIEVMFVNIDTSLGRLQFVAYNSHNGYYGHTASVSSSQLSYETTL